MATKALRLAGIVALLYAARRYYRNWGTTKEQCRMHLAGDELIEGAVIQTTEAAWINAPAGTVWPWLVQMGQDRAGLYSYESLENLLSLDYHNANHIHPEWQHLQPGDVMRLARKGWMGLRDGIVLHVVEVVEPQSIVLRVAPEDQFWDGVWSFHVIPHREDRCRLLIRTRTRVRHPGKVLLAEAAGPAQAFLTRGILRGIRRRAQQQFQAEASAVKAASSVHPAG